MTTDETSVLLEIQRIAARDLDVGRPLQATDRLIEDLGLDSLTLTTLAVALEDHFRVTLSDEEAARVRTVGELARCVASRASGSS